MTTELARIDGLVTTFDEATRAAKAMALSGYFTDANKAAQAMVKILAGVEMGFGPFASMTGINIIKGKPSIGANLMAAAVKSHPRYDYRVRKMQDDVVALEFFERAESVGMSEFTKADAQKAGTQNMGKFARNMLFARAMSNGVKWYAPDVFNGSAVYTPDELGATVDGDGQYVDAPARVVDVEEIPVTQTKRAVVPPLGDEPPEGWNMDEQLQDAEPPASYLDVVELGVFDVKAGGKPHIGLMADGNEWPDIRWWKGRDELLEAAPWLGESVTKDDLGEMGARYPFAARVVYTEDGKGYKVAERFEPLG